MNDISSILSTALASHRFGEIIGLIGAAVYIGGFFLVQTGRVCGNSIAYPLSKVIAAALVLFSLFTAFNLAAFVIQIAYAWIGIYGVLRRLALKPARDTPTRDAARPIRAVRPGPRQGPGAVSVLG